MAGYVSDAVIRRLPGYYRHLRELEAAGVTQISSQELGRRMQLTPSQIRQDINCCGGVGRQGYGYKVSELKEHIGEILGVDKPHKMIILGAGNIGGAIANYPTFAREGFVTTAVFDVDERKVGTEVRGVTVRHMDDLEDYLAREPADIAVMALPAGVAQDTIDRLYECGVRAVWNFAPTDLNHSDDMIVVNVHLSDSLQILSYRMAHRDEE